MAKQRRRARRRVETIFAIVNVGDDGKLEMRYDPALDAIEFIGAEPGTSRTDQSYARASGKPKITTSIPSEGTSSFSPHKAIMAFDFLIAIDTNCRVIQGVRCAVCSSVYVPGEPKGFTTGIPYRSLVNFLIVGIGPFVKAEPLGWWLTLKSLKKISADHLRVGVVVDSELGQHKSINTRRTPYYAEAFLPEDHTLIYASADVDSDSLQGKMIKACDKTSSSALEDIARRKLPLLKPNGEGNFTAFAILQTSRDQGR